MSQLEFLDTPGSQPRYRELSGGWNARNAAARAPARPRPAPPRPQAGKVNDAVFAEGSGSRCTRTGGQRPILSRGAAATVSRPSRARPRSRPGCSAPRAAAKGKRPLIGKQEVKEKKRKKNTSRLLERLNVRPLPKSDSALQRHRPQIYHVQFVAYLLTGLDAGFPSPSRRALRWWRRQSFPLQLAF